MKWNKKYLTPMLIGLAFGGSLFFHNQEVHAAVLTGNTDTTGAITGTAGAVYYDAASWADMRDTYQSVTPSTTSNNTVYFNITADVPGDSSVGGTGSANVTEGKSLSIIGNGHMLYLDSDTNYTTAGSGSGAGGGTVRGAFRASNSNVTNATTLTVKNASITNNITGGIFQSISTAAPTFVYQDVTVSNGAATAAAQPIRNDNGRILLKGDNTFNVLSNNNMNNQASTSDNQGEWVQGGKWVEVVDGTTTLNQNWGQDQPFYTYNNNSHTLQVDTNAQLKWNLNYTYCMYYDDGNSGPMIWNLEDDSAFNINGTDLTASRYSGGWFYAVANNSWTVNVGQRSRLAVSTGGGYINLNGFTGSGVVNWNFAQDSEVLINNLKTGNLLYGAPGAGSGIYIEDAAVFTLNNGSGGQIFNSNVGNKFPITINGNGLRTHASSKYWGFNDLNDLNSPNMTTLDTVNGDIWYRQNTGSLTGLGSTLTTNLTPNDYSAADKTAINKAQYLSFYKPLGYWINADLSSMDRTFDISLDPAEPNGTPLDGSWSNFIAGNTPQKLVVGDDRGQAPSYHVTVQMLKNNFPDSTQYYWTDPSNNTPTQFAVGTSLPVASITSDSSLPSWINMTGAGAFYTMNFNVDQGIQLKANNHLMLANNEEAGSFQYTIADGPA